MFKVDLFVAGDDSVARQELERRQTFVVDEESSETLTVASAPDNEEVRLLLNSGDLPCAPFQESVSRKARIASASVRQVR